MNKETLKILNQFNKAIKMGEDSYAIVIEKTDDKNFKKILQAQSKEYENFLNYIHIEYENIDKEPADTPITQKVMGWTSIQINTLKDSSNSHISEMLIQGAIMGYIECHKLINSNLDMDDDLKDQILKFSNLQEKVIRELTPFLRK